MLKLILFFITIFTIIFPSQVISQTVEDNNQDLIIDDVVESIDPALKLNLTIKPQEYPSKRFDVVLEIDSLIDSDRVAVEWRYPSRYYNFSGKNREIVSVQSGQKTTIVRSFIPKPNTSLKTSQTKVEIGIKVSAVAIDSTYISSSKKPFNINNEFENLPISIEYQNQKNTNILIIWGGGIILALIIILISVFGFIKFTQYLNSD